MIIAVRGVCFFTWVVLSTVVYGIGVMLIGPVLRKSAWRIGNAWCRHLLAVGGVRIRMLGAGKLNREGRYVFISNHVSALDIPLLIAALPLRAIFMAKKELFRVPFFGWGISILGHLPIDRESARKARESIIRAVEDLQAGRVSVIIFPEGTRSKTGLIGEFKHASFSLAKEAAVDIVPVFIQGAQQLLPKKALFIRPGTITLHVGEPLPAAAFKDLDRKELSAIVHEKLIAMQASVGVQND
jgi:1-acyl-sn-glycerol-3-phosphate acyltransferase